MTHHLPLIALMCCGAAHAGPVACLPKPIGTGTAALVQSTPKGQFAAWRCPGGATPAVVACVKSTCGLVGTQRAIAAWASAPTLSGLQAALAPYKTDPHTDPALRAVWGPFKTQIEALK